MKNVKTNHKQTNKNSLNTFTNMKQKYISAVCLVKDFFHEIVDLASVKPVPLSTLIKIKNVLKKTFKNNEFEVRCLIDTSDKFIKRLIKQEEVSVICKYNDGSNFNDYRLKFKG